MTRTRQKKERSNFKAGLSTIVVLVAGFTFILAIIRTNANNQSGTDYRLSFTMSDGMGGLEAGSLITAAGINVGQITKVTIDESRLSAYIFIKEPYTLFPGALIYRSDSAMGGGATLTIGSFGDNREPRLKDGAMIQSAPQPPALNSLIGDADASRIKEIQKNTEELSRGIRQIAQDLQKSEELATLNDDFRILMSQTSSDAEVWEPKFQRIQRRMEAFQEAFPELNRQFDQLDETSQMTERNILELNDVLSPERRRLLVDAMNEAIQDATTISARVEEEVLPQVRSIIDQATRNWNDLNSIEGLLKTMASDARRTMQVAVANSALAAQQLTLAQKEIIGSLGIPLLQTPSLEDQRLGIRIETLERWARSATQLRRFLSALEMLKDSRDSIKDDALLERLMDSLRAALADFEDAQSRLISLGESGQDAPDETDDQNQ